MKTIRLWLEADTDIPAFKRLRYAQADAPLADIIFRGIHPSLMDNEITGREIESLRRQLYLLLNDPEIKIPHMVGLGYGVDLEESNLYYSHYDLEANLAKITERIRFVDELDYPRLVELAMECLRGKWSHEHARDLAQKVYPDFNDLRDFLKQKDKRVKLSGYKDLDNYDLSRITTVEDFTGQDKALVACAVKEPNFRKTSFLEKVTTPEGFLSLTSRFDWFGLELQEQQRPSEMDLYFLCEVEGETIHVMPDPGANPVKRRKAESFARRWSGGTGAWCFNATLDAIGQMLEEPNVKLTFDGFRYGEKTPFPPSACMSLRGPAIKRFAVQKYPTEDSTNELVKEILGGHEISMSGRKEQLLGKLVTLVTERYKALESSLDRFFIGHSYLKIPQDERKKGDPFPVLEDKPLDQLILGMYIARHLRGNVVLEAAGENSAAGIADTARALIDKRIDLDFDFIAVEGPSTKEVKP